MKNIVQFCFDCGGFPEFSEQSVSPACVCVYSICLHVQTFGSANVKRAFGALCCHMRVTVMATERYQEVKGTFVPVAVVIPLLLPPHLFSSVFP